MNGKRKNQFLNDLMQFMFLGAAFMVLWCGFAYWFNQPKDKPKDELPSVKESIEQYKEQRYGKAKESECTWCGGVGRVGYAGASEAQVRRTGNGLGNYCISCEGTGKIKTYGTK